VIRLWRIRAGGGGEDEEVEVKEETKYFVCTRWSVGCVVSLGRGNSCCFAVQMQVQVLKWW
jgi:hypothetical protein